jgi:hypothetical protein
MKPRTLIPLLGAGVLMLGTGIAVQVASAGEHPELAARYTEAGFWPGGLIGTFTINNKSTEATGDWKLAFSLPSGATVAGVWNGKLSTVDGGGYVVRPAAGARLDGHATMTVGFTAKADTPVAPTKCTINGTACTMDVAPAAPAAPAVELPADTGSAGVLPGKPAAPAPAGPAAPAPAGPPGGSGTAFAPSVFLPAVGRPPLKALAAGAGTTLLTLADALPSLAGACDLKWGGTADLDAYLSEITDALKSRIGLVGSIGTAGGVDLAQVCGTAGSLEAQVRRLVALGIRSIDFTIAENALGDVAANLRRAQVVKDLKAQGVTVSYTLPVPDAGALGVVTAPLLAAKNAGALLDRVNILPVDLGAPGLLGSLLGGSTVDGVIGAVTGVHDQLMKINGLDASAAWRMVGIVPVLGGGDLLGDLNLLGGTSPLALVTKLAAFAKANGLGLLGFLPLGTGQSCAGGVSVPLLNCLDPSVLARFFAVADTLRRTLG